MVKVLSIFTFTLGWKHLLCDVRARVKINKVKKNHLKQRVIKVNRFDSGFCFRLMSHYSNGGNDSMLREKINNVLKTAMKAKEQTKVSTLRLINAAVKDRDIADRTKGGVDEEGISDDGILQLLQSMVKQRRDSIEAYNKGGRPELAARESEEIEVIQQFLPEQLDDDEMTAAVMAVIKEIGAESLKEMGAVMAKLREDYAGQLDFGKVSGIVKERLG